MKQHKEELQRVQELERYGEEALKELKKSSLYLCHEANRAQNKGRSTDDVRPRWLFDRTNFRFGGHFTGHGLPINN